jgi:hypothetical protein
MELELYRRWRCFFTSKGDRMRMAADLQSSDDNEWRRLSFEAEGVRLIRQWKVWFFCYRL